MKYAVVGITAAVLVSLVQFAQAQGAATLPLRDPTMAPNAVGSDTVGSDVANGGMPLPLGGSGSNVVVREGKSYLVVGSRLVALGQTVENYKLERITETEIWLRDASGLTKVARFAGVQRQATPTHCPTAKPAPKKTAKKAVKAKPRQAQPTPIPTGAKAPRPTSENEAHDC